MGKLKHEERLMYAIGFTEEDLEANRSGQLSERQQHYFRRERLFWLMAVILAVSVGIIAGINYLTNQNSASSSLIPVLWLISAIFAVAILLGATQRLLNINYIIHSNKALSLRGTVKHQIDHDPRFNRRLTPFLTLEIQHVKIPLSYDQYRSFKNGDPYIIYYAPRTRKLLSAEWLRDGDPFEPEEIPEKRKHFD